MPSLTPTSFTIILELSFITRTTVTAGLSHPTHLFDALDSSTELLIAYHTLFTHLPWMRQCHPTLQHGSSGKFVCIFHIFVTQTVKYFCQTNSLLQLPPFRLLSAVRLAFGSHYKYNWFKHTPMALKWVPSTTLFSIPPKSTCPHLMLLITNIVPCFGSLRLWQGWIVNLPQTYAQRLILYSPPTGPIEILQHHIHCLSV